MLSQLSHTRSFARRLVLPIVSAGILGGAALGLAGMANAGTYAHQPEPRPGLVAIPNIYAPPTREKTSHHDHKHGSGYTNGFPVIVPSAQ